MSKAMISSMNKGGVVVDVKIRGCIKPAVQLLIKSTYEYGSDSLRAKYA